MVNARHCKNDIADVEPQLHFPHWVVVTSTVCGVISFVFGCGVRIVNLPLDKRESSIQPGRLQNIHQVPLEELRDASANYTSSSESWFVFDASDRGEDDESAAGIGNQLLVDIKNVNAGFLNSEERLKRAMITLLTENDFEPESNYCRSRNHAGYSCYGHFDEAVMNLYTFPFHGVISLDLFTRDEEDLISFLEKIEGAFALPEERSHQLDEDYPPPQMIWTHKLRNFRHEFGVEDHEGGKSVVEGELTQDILSQPGFEIKRQLAFVETKFQNVHFYEAINTRFRSVASYENSLSKDGSYESLHPELFRPDKIVFLDGDSQSSLYGEAVYHEGLVHAAMLTHPNPKRVAIIGGGEGATLREVLKHKTVEEVVMVDIDGEFVQLCRKYLPEWSDCSDLVGSTAPSCFDDDRARVYFEDAFQWFIDRFATDDNKKSLGKEDFFDVIIMDACDPTNDFVTKLYVDLSFVLSIYNGLSESGVFVAQIGRSSSHTGGIDETKMFKNMFEEVGFQSMHIYDEGRSGFYEPWSQLVALKSASSRTLWYRNSAQTEIELQKRISKTHSGKPALLYFDASVRASYQLPDKVHEDVYCRLQERRECKAVWEMIKNHTIDVEIISNGDAFNPLYERIMLHNEPNDGSLQSLVVVSL